jgi:hypothetical protein
MYAEPFDKVRTAPVERGCMRAELVEAPDAVPFDRLRAHCHKLSADRDKAQGTVSTNRLLT